MKAPILITGCARSGTSLVAGIINICGAFGGDMSGPNANNAKGMFENAAIRNKIVKPFYESLGVDRLGQYPLPNVNELVIPMNWKERVEDVFLEQGYQGGPWMYKGAKMCQHWPVWQWAFPDAKWVIVRRKDEDIVNSCLRTGFMRAFRSGATQKEIGVKNESQGWLWWVQQHKDRFREMQDAGLNTTVIWPEKMVEGNYVQVKDMIEWLGLEWKEKEVVEFISPRLWKARQKR